MFEPNVRVRRLFEDLCHLAGRKPDNTLAPAFLSLTEEIARVLQVQPDWTFATLPEDTDVDITVNLEDIEKAVMKQKIFDSLYDYANSRTYDDLMKVLLLLVMCFSSYNA